MALLTRRQASDCVLPLESGEAAHIFEPEFHQDIYVKPIADAQNSKYGAFQILNDGVLKRSPNRGKQPEYADDLDNPASLKFIGKLHSTGKRLTAKDTCNVAALKSVSIRAGYVDIDSGRSVSKEFWTANQERCSVQRGDVLINSTGDGSIGRVAVYHYDFPAVVDGHITILRFQDQALGWYTAAYLMSQAGQRQIYRYINGSSGQVEIYPQDIGRLWIPRRTAKKMAQIVTEFQEACFKFGQFRDNLGSALALTSG